MELPAQNFQPPGSLRAYLYGIVTCVRMSVHPSMHAYIRLHLWGGGFVAGALGMSCAAS